MTMPPRVRRFALTVHVVSSVGWLGAAVAYLILAIAAVASEDLQMVGAAYLALEPTAWFAILPLAFAALLTGLVQALGTTWGLFRHYWVVVKLVLTLLATVVLLLHLPTVSRLAGLAANRETADPAGLSGEVVHAGGGVVVLLVTAALAVYKPAGRTPRGWRKQRSKP